METERSKVNCGGSGTLRLLYKQLLIFCIHALVSLQVLQQRQQAAETARRKAAEAAAHFSSLSASYKQQQQQEQEQLQRQQQQQEQKVRGDPAAALCVVHG